MFKLFDHVIDKFIMNFKPNSTIFVPFVKRPVVNVLGVWTHTQAKTPNVLQSLHVDKQNTSTRRWWQQCEILQDSKVRKKTRGKDLDFLKQFNGCNIDDGRGIDGLKIQVRLFNHDKRLSEWILPWSIGFDIENLCIRRWGGDFRDFRVFRVWSNFWRFDSGSVELSFEILRLGVGIIIAQEKLMDIEMFRQRFGGM